MIASVTSSLVVEGLAAGPFQQLDERRAALRNCRAFSISHPAEIIFVRAGRRLGRRRRMVVHPLAARYGNASLQTSRSPTRSSCRSAACSWASSGSGCRTFGGNGYHAANLVLNETPVFGFVALLLIMKIVATSLTIGSGGSGGIFTPTLFVGVCAGSGGRRTRPHDRTELRRRSKAVRRGRDGRRRRCHHAGADHGDVFFCSR